jgi:cytosine/adenosine deaminase-related metal-dependent hydrolase
MITLIKNGLVVTFEPDALRGRIIANGAVAVEDGKIAAIGETRELEARYAKPGAVIDATGRIVMPGFIVTHTHMPYVLGHNMPVDFSQLKSFWDMLQKMGWEWLEDITTAEGIYAATRYAAAKMLKSGTTTVCELVEGPNALPGALDASAKAIDEVGIRAQLGFEVTERIPGISILERLDPAAAEKGFAENLRLMEKYPAGGPGRIQARLGVHTAFTNSLDTLRKARRIADERKCGIQIHVAEIPRAFLVENGKFTKVIGPGARARRHRAAVDLKRGSDPAPELGQRCPHPDDQLPGRQRRGPGTRHAGRGHERHAGARLFLHP